MERTSVANINEKINKRAATTQPSGAKAVRGTGEGWWSREQKDQRTKEHKGNWGEKHHRATGRIELIDRSITGIGAPSTIMTASTPYDLSPVHIRTRRTQQEPESIITAAEGNNMQAYDNMMPERPGDNFYRGIDAGIMNGGGIAFEATPSPAAKQDA